MIYNPLHNGTVKDPPHTLSSIENLVIPENSGLVTKGVQIIEGLSTVFL